MTAPVPTTVGIVPASLVLHALDADAIPVCGSPAVIATDGTPMTTEDVAIRLNDLHLDGGRVCTRCRVFASQAALAEASQ